MSVKNSFSKKTEEPISFGLLLQKATRYCAYQERSVFQTKQKLKSWNANPQQIEKILDYLLKNDFINDERFADVFIKGKFCNKNWGKIKILNHLHKHNIDQSIINVCFEALEKDVYVASLKKIMIKKLESLKKENDKNILKQKIIRFCLSKGFEFEIIIATFDTLNKNK